MSDGVDDGGLILPEMMEDEAAGAKLESAVAGREPNIHHDSEEAASLEDTKVVLMGDDDLLEALLDQHGECHLPDEGQKGEEHQHKLDRNFEDDLDGDDALMDQLFENSQMKAYETSHDIRQAHHVDFPLGKDEETQMSIGNKEEVKVEDGYVAEEFQNAAVEDAAQGAETTINHDLKENFQQDNFINKNGTDEDDATGKPVLFEQLDVDDAINKSGIDMDDATDKSVPVEQLDVDGEKLVSSNSSAGVSKQEENKIAVTQVEAEPSKHDLGTNPDINENQLPVPMEQSFAGENEMTVVQSAPSVEDVRGEDSGIAIEGNDMDADFPARGGKKKRGRPKGQVSKNKAAKPQYTKKLEEDVCFICFDGGNLVVCDRRGCPKVYHPSCVNRDEAFFRAKGRWNCGWHICSLCEKAAHYMCYTCTYSLCKVCIKESDFVCVRGNKGFCGTCRSTVMLIETNTQTGVNFDDKNSWEYLFKDYWLDLKGRLSITFDEVAKAKKPSRRILTRNEESSDENYEANEVAASSSDSSSGRRDDILRKRVKKGRKAVVNDDDAVGVSDSVGSSLPGQSEWASKELLEFVSHMKDGDMSILSQFDVQALLLEYIKRNNLRDPRRKSQIICDSRLENLFGKPRVGHFEMLKLLESHFLIKESSQVGNDDDLMASGDTDAIKVDTEASSDAKSSFDKKKKSRRKDEREMQANYDDYAAIDVHNISMIYLRRNLMEDLIDDFENFCQKVVGTFVRIRISGSNQRQDMYRLVLVTGTSKATEKYRTGKKTTDIMLEILNLNKPEVIPIDSISNQEFTEEECKRLRQSIKIGFIPRMTVGELQEKAMALQVIKVNDWLETEKLRLSHLRDRASETGRRKQLRECVEKLELLNTPDERSRRLSEIPEVHSDPNMDPSYESAEEDESDNKREKNSWARESSFIRRRGINSSERTPASNDGWNGSRSGSTIMLEVNRDASADVAINATDPVTWNRGKDMLEQSSLASPGNHATLSVSHPRHLGNSQVSGAGHQSGITSHSAAGVVTTSINESDKIWHYQDPSGKIQGPFSMVQLRKWNSTGYFPRDLRIWKTSEKQDDSVLLTDALIGKFQKEQPSCQSNSNPVSVPVKDAVTANAMGNANSKWMENVRTNPYGSVAIHQSDSGQQSSGQQRQFQSSLTPLSIPIPSSSNQGNSMGVKSSNWSMPSPTPPTEPLGVDDKQDSGQVFDPENVNTGAVVAPKNANANWGTAVTGNVNNMWAAPVQANDKSNWTQANPNVNMGWASATPGNPTVGAVSGPPANTNVMAGWGAPNLNGLAATAGWVAPMQVNAPVNPGWGAPVQVANPGWVMTGQENSGAIGSWGAPQAQQGHVNPAAGWGAVGQGIQNANPGWNTGTGNNNFGWNASSANPSNRSNHRENKDRHSGHRNSYEAGRDGGRQRTHHGGAGSSWSQRGEKPGVCKYHESGRCRKGSSCNFLHT